VVTTSIDEFAQWVLLHYSAKLPSCRSVYSRRRFGEAGSFGGGERAIPGNAQGDCHALQSFGPFKCKREIGSSAGPLESLLQIRLDKAAGTRLCPLFRPPLDCN